jgi:hypothetical protein
MSPLTFEQALSLVLAHTVVYEARRPVDEAFGHARWSINAGGDAPPSVEGESTDEMMRAWIQHLPSMLRTQSQVTRELAPQENADSLALARQFMPDFTQLGINQGRQQALGQADTDLSVLEGPGKDLASAALEAQRRADPEYYRTREQASNALAMLMSSLDPATGELSGGERAEIERSVNRDNSSAGIAAPTATSTVDNAMRFGAGSELKKRGQQGAITGAITAATGAMPAMKSGIDTFQLTTGRPAVTNVGMGQFAGTHDLAARNAQTGAGLMGQIGSNMANAQQVNANRRDSLDRLSQVIGSIPSISCCWIFRERYGAEIPWYVRASRDAHYTPRRRAGYQRMSKWLIPAMRRSALVRTLVGWTLFRPLAAHAKWDIAGDGNGWFFEPVKFFWLNTWSALGALDGSAAEAYG